jgi:hypothetical protein
MGGPRTHRIREFVYTQWRMKQNKVLRTENMQHDGKESVVALGIHPDGSCSSNLLRTNQTICSYFNRFAQESEELAFRPTVQSGMTFQTKRPKSKSARFLFPHLWQMHVTKYTNTHFRTTLKASFVFNSGSNNTSHDVHLWSGMNRTQQEMGSPDVSYHLIRPYECESSSSQISTNSKNNTVPLY